MIRVASAARSVTRLPLKFRIINFVITSRSVVDISPLSGLVSLVDLRLEDPPITEISPLSGLINLERLSFTEALFEDLGPLKGLVKLQSLCLAYCRVTDLSPLSELQDEGLDIRMAINSESDEESG